MKDAIGGVLAFAVVAAISPFPIIAVVLMCATPRARANGPAFLLGWIVALAVVGTVILLASSGIDASDDGKPATWVSLLKLVLGALCLFVALRSWRGRHESKDSPKWMAAIDSFTPVKAAGAGALLAAVNPKNLLLTVGAAATIAQTGISAGEQAIALAVYIVIASLGVGAPVAIYFAGGAKSAELLEALKSWMAANNSAIVAVMMLVIGAKLF